MSIRVTGKKLHRRSLVRVRAVEFDIGPAPLLTLVCGLRVCFGGLDAVLSGDFLHRLTTADVADEVVQAADVLVSEVDTGELGVAGVELDR